LILTKGERKRIRSLQTKKGRLKEGRFIAEGIRLLEESIRNNRLPEAVYYSENLISENGQELIKRFRTLKVPMHMTSRRDAESISDTHTAQGILGLFAIPSIEFASISRYKRILLLDNLTDPGNAGTLIRSACAFGIELVLMTPNSVDPFNPKVVRATAGAVFACPIAVAPIKNIAAFKKNNRFQLISADPYGEELNMGLKKVKEKFILAIGSEAAGLSSEIVSMTDIDVRIQHSPKVESLNAAVAGSIIMKELFERFSHRRQK
jgi:TrmH family RNA methyltransferase